MTTLSPGDILFVKVMTDQGPRVQLYAVSEVDTSGTPNGAIWSGVYVNFQGLKSRYSAAFLAGMPENQALVDAIEHDTREKVFPAVKDAHRVQLIAVDQRVSRPKKETAEAKRSAVDVVED